MKNLGCIDELEVMIPDVYICTLFLGTVPDPCLSDPCDTNADCTREGLLSADFTCTCQEPFTDGDGFNCSGIMPLVVYRTN